MATVALQKITTLGPIKMEVVNLTAITNGDTFTTLIQNPLFVDIGEYGASATTATTTAAISGRTVTVTNASMNGTQKAVALVFGF
jgi:hypothetical protein